MAEQSRACWGCGKEPPPGIKFQRCMRCAEAKLPSSYFCGEACMLANWPRHKAWHKAQKEMTATISEAVLEGVTDRSVAERAARVAEQHGGELNQLQAHAASLMSNGDLSGAAKAWRKLIKLRPDLPDPYARLAMTLQRSNLFLEACPLYLKAVELSEPGTEIWGTMVARAFGALRVNEDCAEVPRPAWWNDDDLKAISALAVAVCPDDVNVYAMRAHVLLDIEAVLSSTSFEPRSAEELKEAALCFRRAADLTLSSGCRVEYGNFADACDKVADPMLAEAEAEAAAARKAAEAEAKEAREVAEAEAKEAREVAEAKAAAAAQELLADEEKEKEQAAAKTKDGNAKGKGKKGKGKRS